jgi:hypothetical protein
MRPALLSLAALSGLCTWAGLAGAIEPAYQDRHFRHYRLYDYYLGQDASRREYSYGPPGYPLMPATELGRGPRPTPPYVLPAVREYVPIVVPEYVPPVPEVTPTYVPDSGYSYYREYRELQLAKRLVPTRPEAAKRRLRDIIDRYPGTRAAVEAAELLQKLP